MLNAFEEPPVKWSSAGGFRNKRFTTELCPVSGRLCPEVACDLAVFCLTPPPCLRLQPSPPVSPSTDFTHYNHHVSLLPRPPDLPSSAATAASSPFDGQRGLRPSNEETHTPGRGALAGERSACRGELCVPGSGVLGGERCRHELLVLGRRGAARLGVAGER
ncbi:hypothetical protein Droror1_Dr00013105 [Drosera rotundifolia]